MIELAIDIWTVMRKEIRELFTARGPSLTNWATVLLAIAVFGVVLPLQLGPAVIEQMWLLALWGWLPAFIVTGVVADSIAGERERHTLETLLATRLSDRAILLGKMATAVLYSWSVMIVCLIVGLVSLNVAYWSGTLLTVHGLSLLALAVLSLLVAALTASIGVLVSLQAASVRRAQQILSGGVFVLFLLLAYGRPLLLRLLPPQWLSDFSVLFEGAGVATLVLVLIALLTVADGALFALLDMRFQRNRLTLG